MGKKKRPSPALVAQLKAAIRASGQTLTQLSVASGVHQTQLARFMAGERDLTLSSAGHLCEALGIKLDVPEHLQQEPAEPPPEEPGDEPKKPAPKKPKK